MQNSEFLNQLESFEREYSQSPYESPKLLRLIDFLTAEISNLHPDIAAIAKEKLEIHRNTYSDSFLSDYTFWQTWLLDAQIDRKPVDYIVSLFQKALLFRPQTEVALDYLEYCSSLLENEEMTEEKFRSICEACISLVGMDVYTGSLVWKKYRDFEIDEHDDVMETKGDDLEALKISKKRIISLFHRQLSLPLVGNDRVLKEMDEVLSSVCDEHDLAIIQPEKIQRLYESSKLELDARLIFEDYINSNSFEDGSVALEQRLKSWRAYIALEINEHKYARAQRIYERALMNCSDCIELWKEYLTFAVNTVKNWTLAEEITRRLIKVAYNDIEVWTIRFYALEETKKSNDLISAYYQALQSGLSSADDYLTVHFSKSSYYRRQVQEMYKDLQKSTHNATQDDATIDLAQLMISLRSSNNEIKEFMDKYYPQWTEGWIRVYRFICSIENEVIEIISDTYTTLAASNTTDETFHVKSIAKDTWEEAVKRFGKSYAVWKEYVAWSRFYQDPESTRKLYRRMMSLIHDEVEVLYQDWIQFEYETGTAADIFAASARVQGLLAKLKIKRVQAEVQKTEKVIKVEKKEVSSKKRPRDGDSSHPQDSQSSKIARKESDRVHTNNEMKSMPLKKAVMFADKIEEKSTDDVSTTTKDKLAQNTNEKNQGNSNTMNLDETTTTAPSSATDAMMMPNDHATSNHNSNQLDTAIEVSNMTFTTTIEEVKSHFLSCQSLRDVRLILAKSGRPRGIAVFYLDNKDEIDTALSYDKSTLNGRQIHVQRSAPIVNALPVSETKDEHKESAEYESGALTTVFVTNFGLSNTEEELRKLLTDSFGDIRRMKLAVDKETRKLKGTGLIEFVSIESKRKAIQMTKKVPDKEGLLLKFSPSKFTIEDRPGKDSSSSDSKDVQKPNPYLMDESSSMPHPTPKQLISDKSDVKKSATTFRPRGLSMPKK